MFQRNNFEMVLMFFSWITHLCPLMTKKDYHIVKEFDDIPTKKKNYEPNCKCQDNWAS